MIPTGGISLPQDHSQADLESNTRCWAHGCAPLPSNAIQKFSLTCTPTPNPQTLLHPFPTQGYPRHETRTRPYPTNVYAPAVTPPARQLCPQ